MWRSRRCVAGAAVVALGLAGCSSPVSPSGSVTVTTAGLVSPANGTLVPNAAQPVTLTVSNALVTGVGTTVTYRFEVATDTLFKNIVVSSNVPQGTGQTSFTLSTLPPGQQYFWHVQTTGADTTGAFTQPLAFSIGAAVVLQAPQPVVPIANSGLTIYGWPTFTVNDAARTGPSSTLVYRFDMATDPGFASIVMTATLPETPGQTSYSPAWSAASPSKPVVYWRATAIDQTNIVSSPASTTESFAFTPLWPGVQPPGTLGQAVLGNNWQPEIAVSFTGVTFVSPSLDEMQVFDLLNRGFDPQGAINWMQANGYPTQADWVPADQVIGFTYEYMALIGGSWNLVIRSGS